MRLRKRVEKLEKNSKKVTLWDFPRTGFIGEFGIEELFADILRRLSDLENAKTK